MKFTLTVVALFSVLGRADAALRNSNAPVITSSDESESSQDTPKPAEDTHSFLSENGSSTNACYSKYRYPKCGIGGIACDPGMDQSKVGCGSCRDDMACVGYTGDSIGEKSCTGLGSCMDASATIGKNSCNGVLACSGATGWIGDNQCNTEGEDECRDKNFPALSLYEDDIFAGGCRSSLGKLYSDVRIATTYLSKLGFKDSPEGCAQFCRKPSLNNGFQVGMQFGDGKCLCKYDGGGKLPSLLPPGAVTRVTKGGYGPVTHGGKRTSLKCYPLKQTKCRSLQFE